MSVPHAVSYFVAGTDTGIGKTLVASALVHALAAQGHRVAGMKPVASGTTWQDGAWHNEDVDALRAVSNVDLPAMLVNPYLLHDPTAPHIAAASEGIRVDLKHIENCFHAVRARADTVIVEGVGGFVVPLNEHDNTDDLVCRLGLPVILVVGIRLGCINHALLTMRAIAARGLHVAGWVANIVAPDMMNVQSTIASIKSRMTAPMLGCIPHLAHADPAHAATFLDISALRLDAKPASPTAAPLKN